MTISTPARRTAKRAATPTSSPLPTPDDWRGTPAALGRTLELVFFAHMEMADASDRILAEHGLGRPHHRVLYFAQLSPGITVGELTTLLRISNQALSRTMQQIATLGLIEQCYCPDDRRVRRHFVTEQGAALLARSKEKQFAVIRKAHLACPQADIEAFWRTLTLLSRPEDLVWISRHPGACTPPPASATTEGDSP
ncbi:MarR family winged helix-turn-helix transcriptional regulator [Pseudorhodoferax soli]|uniref:DNA-binding MarR family transcriptional regulator n=1 Tax=Pseudorhodoferax soli TaxID=545864 RepID=A0A368XN59_9BURK|nr:MarR family winged helix-turn-helix transcriptional regulator [Pseudorhodoferax soli]RCW69410.1 DNA-binding MarR family transcriptional regulator [Pseudorhodoferax soli]